MTVRLEETPQGPVREGVVEEVTCSALRIRLPKGLDEGVGGVLGGGVLAGVLGGVSGKANLAGDDGMAVGGVDGEDRKEGVAVMPGMMEREDTDADRQRQRWRDGSVLWRVDKAEYASTWSRVRGALARFFAAKSAVADGGWEGRGGQRDRGKSGEVACFAAKHRRLIVDLEAPRFSPAHCAHTQAHTRKETDAKSAGMQEVEGQETSGKNRERDSECLWGKSGEGRKSGERRKGEGRKARDSQTDQNGEHHEDVKQGARAGRQQGMNEEQEEALERVLGAEDYVLLLGMPGTGKTTTIAAIVWALVARGSKVLLTSFTNNAVDNMVIKLAETAADGGPQAAAAACVRLQSRGHRVPPEIAHLVLHADMFGSSEELGARMQEVKVVATTCHNVHHALIRHLSFDVCIIDEASQVRGSSCPMPLPPRLPLTSYNMHTFSTSENKQTTRM